MKIGSHFDIRFIIIPAKCTEENAKFAISGGHVKDSEPSYLGRTVNTDSLVIIKVSRKLLNESSKSIL